MVKDARSSVFVLEAFTRVVSFKRMGKYRYEELFLENYEACEEKAQKKIGRKLTNAELSGIRNAGSLTMLGSVEMTIQSSGITGTDLAETLEKTSESFESRKAEALPDFISAVEKEISRQLNQHEKEFILGVLHLTEIFRLLVELDKADSTNKEQVWAQFMQK